MKKVTPDIFSTRSINRDLALSLVLTIVIVASVVGAINFYYLSKREIRNLRQEADEIAGNLARLTGQSIYRADHETTYLTLQETQKGSNVVSVSVYDEMNSFEFIGAEIQEPQILVKKPILLFDNRLGSVDVALSMNKMDERQRDFLIYSIIVACCLVLSISIVSVVLLNRFLQKPLTNLLDSVRAISAGSYEHRLSPIRYHYLNQIAQSVNTMAENISARERRLQALVGTLEEQAAEREATEEKLRSLTNELVLAEERERREIASELHDRIGHALTNMAMQIGLVKNISSDPETKEVMTQIDQSIKQTNRDVQSLIFEISPPVLYDLGLIAAVKWLARETSKDHELKIDVIHDDELKLLSEGLRVFVFRAVRELLFNVIKHARASRVEILISRLGSNLEISVIDDGVGMPENIKGFLPDTEGYGLFSIRERLNSFNGRLIVSSKPDQGTSITIKIPTG